MTAQDEFSPEQIAAMVKHPEGVAKKLGPNATPEAIAGSAEMVALLGKAFTLAGPGGRVGLETIGPSAGKLVRIVKGVEDLDETDT